MIYTGDGSGAYADAISSGLTDMFGETLRNAVFGGEWSKNGRSRAPYVDAWKLGENGITLFASPTLTHACIEISGQGCERLIAMETLGAVLESSGERVTRIDIASDIETAIMPDEFVAQVSHERMRASGYQKSETGETAYVGSQKSDRYARVYRYAEPHPRSKLLRVEHVFRRDYAKKVAHACAQSGVDSVARAAGDAFGWSHAVWKPEGNNDTDISTVGAERKMGKTVFWLVHSVAPAFRRLIAEGVIKDPEAFIQAYFLAE